MKASLRMAILVAAASAAACAGLKGDEGSAAVTGRAIYPHSSIFLRGSVLRAQLLEVSRQDVRAGLISETTISLDGRQPPVEFRLIYRREAIKPSQTYSVRAAILVGERMLYTTTESYPVLTRNAPADISIRLQPVIR